MNRIAKLVIDHPLLAWMVLGVVALGGGYLAGEVARVRLEQEHIANLQLDAERSGIQLMSQTLNGNQMGAIGLLGLIDDNAKKEALNRRAPNSKEATALMQGIGRLYDADGTYIVGEDGIIKSSWGIGRPLTGVDVKFRPYTQMAFKGTQNVYAAIGTTTGRRNLYYAVPLYAGKSVDTAVIGAVVLRSGVERLDRMVLESGALALLLSPQRIVFSASHDEWIGRAAGQLTPERVKEIRQLRQFGTLFDSKDPEPLPFVVERGIAEVDGVRHAVVEAKVNWNDPYGDWTLVVMEDLSRGVPLAPRLWLSLAAGVLILFVGGLVNLLLRGYRRQVEAAEQLSHYSRQQQAGAERKAQLAAVSLRLQQCKTRASLIEAFFAEMHRTLRMMQGVAYAMEPGSTTDLLLAGSYACAEDMPAVLKAGEGLLGQCVLERRLQVIPTAEAGFGVVRSGLGRTRPAALVMAPILLNDNLIGVLEVALLTVPGEEQTTQFGEMVAMLAMNLEILGRSLRAEERLATTAALERASAESLAFQRALIDTFPYPVFYKDAESRFLGVNRAYEQLFGVQSADVIGKRVVDVDYLPESERAAYQAEDEAVIAGAETIRRDIRMDLPDGKTHDMLYSVSGFRGQDGSPGGMVGTLIDVSAVKDAERELERMADVERFNRLAQGREQRILELKREVNGLARAAGLPEPYATSLVEPVGDHLLAPHPDYRTDIDDGAGTLQLADLVDLDELQKLFAAFCESVGIAAAIIDLQGKVLAAARWQRACTDFHRANRESCARCIESDTQLALELGEGRDFALYRCRNGMTDAAAPIMVEGRHLANVFIGQFHAGPPDLTFFREQARQFGYPEDDYLKAVSGAPVVDERRLPVILGFLTGFARMISTMSLARRRVDAAQRKLQEQAVLLQRERLAAMSLAEDNVRARQARVQDREMENP